MSGERYAVASCHVERPLDDAVWERFSAIQRARPGGFAIAALYRREGPAHGEDETRWLERARAAADRGPLGHHTHWTAPDHARPTGAGTGERVLEEGRRFRELGLAPSAFCGGGWYADVDVAEACAALGYVDCTPRSARPAYLPAGARWSALAAPATVTLPSGATLRAIPTTHSLGELVRALARRELPPLVHVYFHDTDLLEPRRRALLHVGLRLLARRARVSDLDAVAALALPDGPNVPWADVERI